MPWIVGSFAVAIVALVLFRALRRRHGSPTAPKDDICQMKREAEFVCRLLEERRGDSDGPPFL